MTISSKEEERMIEKIRKLFALAANKGSQGNESENALRMANALLAKHAIDKFKLHDNEEVFASFMDYNIKQVWVKKVCSHIGRLYNCRVIFDYNWDDPKTLIIGTSSNRITAIIVIDQLLDQIKKETKGKRIDFKNGAAFGLWEVCKRIIDNRQTDLEEAVPGTGLMIIDVDKQMKMNVDDFIRSNFKHLACSNRGGRMSAEGRAYGNGLNPGARMNGSGQKCLN